MTMHARADAGNPAPTSRRGPWLALAASLLLLLLLGGGVGGVVWWRGHNATGETEGNKKGPETPEYNGPIELCNDNLDPKELEPLTFGPPLDTPFLRKHLDALKDRPIDKIELYPWQPEGLVGVLGEHRMRGQVFVASPDGKNLVVGSPSDGYLRIGPAKHLHEQTLIPCPGVVAMVWSPDGDVLAVACPDGQVRHFDVSNLKKIPEPVLFDKTTGPITSLSFSGDGKYLLGGDSTPKLGVAWVWEVEHHKIVKQLKHYGPVMSVAFSPVRGEYRALTVGGVEDHRLRLWDVFSDKKTLDIDFSPEKKELDAYPQVGEVAISPDGKRGLSAHPDGIVRLWDLEQFKKGSEVAKLAGHAGVPYYGAKLAFSPDGKYIATGLLNGNTVWLWNGKDGTQVRKLGGASTTYGGVYSIRFLDADRVALAATNSNDYNIHIHEVESGKEVRPLLGHWSGVTCVALSPDGRHVVSGGVEGYVRLWDLEPVAETNQLAYGVMGGVGFHPDGKRVYVFSVHLPTLSIFDVENFQPRTPTYDKPHAGGIYAAAITSDGHYALTSGYHDGTVSMWSLKDGMRVRIFDDLKPLGAQAIALSPDMRRAVTTGGGVMRLLHLRCQSVKYKWPTAAPFATFRPDAQAVFFGGATAPVWNVKEEPKQTDELKVNLSGLSSGQLSGDGQRMAALIGGKAVVYDLPSTRLIWEWTPPPHFHGVAAVALSPDGRHLLTANGDGTVYVISLPL